jgi:Ca-activated chloride channel family protein
VTIEYQQALAYENGEYRLRFPLAVSPRYVPMSGESQESGPRAITAFAAPGATGLVNPVDIVVYIDAGVPIAAANSSYHEATFAKAGDGRVVMQLVKAQEEADRDFELTWSLAPAATPRAAMFTQSNGGNDYALLMVVPPQPTAAERAAFNALPRETILVIDTSGSMQGASMDQARTALLMALGTLTPRDRFNVIEFNSHTRALHPAAVPATPAALETASKWVKDLKAGGGTEMVPRSPSPSTGRDTPGFLRQVIFVTDGAVGNEEALFKLIRERLGASRLFTVGIGSAPNGHFMTRAAQFGRGTFTYIGDVREVNEKMSRLFAKIEAPVLRDVSIRFPTARRSRLSRAGARPLPRRAGDGGRRRAAPLGTVVVSGCARQPTLERGAHAGRRQERGRRGRPLGRAKIAAHMDELARGASVDEVRPKVVKVALEHHLVSAYTSLVAVDVTPTAPVDGVKSALVRASLPAGYEAHLPQTDTAATLQLMLGLLALLAAEWSPWSDAARSMPHDAHARWHAAPSHCSCRSPPGSLAAPAGSMPRPGWRSGSSLRHGPRPCGRGRRAASVAVGRHATDGAAHRSRARRGPLRPRSRQRADARLRAGPRGRHRAPGRRRQLGAGRHRDTHFAFLKRVEIGDEVQVEAGPACGPAIGERGGDHGQGRGARAGRGGRGAADSHHLLSVRCRAAGDDAALRRDRRADRRSPALDEGLVGGAIEGAQRGVAFLGERGERVSDRHARLPRAELRALHAHRAHPRARGHAQVFRHAALRLVARHGPQGLLAAVTGGEDHARASRRRRRDAGSAAPSPWPRRALGVK